MSEPKLLKGRKPDDAPLIRLSSEQIIVIDRELYTKLMYYINEAKDKECMWHSCVQRISPVTDEVLVYQIYDLFIPHQTVADKEVEASPQQLNDMWLEVKADRGLTMKELGELSKYCCFWGHSHVTMPPKPSPQDEKQWKEHKALCLAPDLKTQEIPMKIVGMIILNQKEEYTNRIYDPEIGAEFHNLPLFIRDPIDYSYIDTAILSKLHKKEPPKTTGGTSSWQGGTGTGTGIYKDTATSATGKAAHSWTGGTSGSPTPQTQHREVQETKAQVVPQATTTSQKDGKGTGTSSSQKNHYTVRGKIPRYWAIPGLETAVQDLEDVSARYWNLANRDDICSRVEVINRIQLRDTDRLTAECRSLVEYLLEKGVKPLNSPELIFTDWSQRAAMATKILQVIGEGYKVSLDRKSILENVKTELNGYVGTLADMIDYFRHEVVFIEQMYVFALTIACVIDQIDHETSNGRLMNEIAVRLIKHLIVVFGHESDV